MKIEFQPTVIGVPNSMDMKISVSELIKAKGYKDNEKAFVEYNEFLFALRMFTYFYGHIMLILGRDFESLLNQIGKTGSVIISCIEESDNPQFLVRSMTNEGEQVINVRFRPGIKGVLS